MRRFFINFLFIVKKTLSLTCVDNHHGNDQDNSDNDADHLRGELELEDREDWEMLEIVLFGLNLDIGWTMTT